MVMVMVTVITVMVSVRVTVTVTVTGTGTDTGAGMVMVRVMVRSSVWFRVRGGRLMEHFLRRDIRWWWRRTWLGRLVLWPCVFAVLPVWLIRLVFEAIDYVDEKTKEVNP